MKQISTKHIIQVMNILKHICSWIVEKYMVEHLKTFRIVLKLLEYIIVLHKFLCAGGKLSYNFVKK